MSQIENPIQQQIIEKMILKLKENKDFDEKILNDLESIDLSIKEHVIEVISKDKRTPNHENTETRD